MRRESVRQWMACAAVALVGAAGCTMLEPEEIIVGGGTSVPNGKSPSMEIMPESVGAEADALPPYASGRMTTRSLIDGETTVAMKANFLRLDEDIAIDDSGLYTYTAAEIPEEEPSASPYYKSVNWNKSYLLEATLMSSPNKDHIRSVYLDPVQTYKMRVYTDENDVTDTLDFYHTRMVGWFPLNCGDGLGSAPICKFGEMFSDKVEESIDAQGNGVVAVQFTGLDGQTDLMVSDMIEGQHWHSPDATPEQSHYGSNYAPAGHPTLAEGTNIYSSPFGSFSQQRIINSESVTTQWAIDYDNHFTYYHYLSAVRIFAQAERSPQNLAMWGNIENVILGNQPTSVKVALPYEMGVKGKAYDWDDWRNIDICTGRIFGDGDTNSELTEEVHFPVSFTDADGSGELYLGYALICPNHDLEIMLHTTSGIYQVTVDSEYMGSQLFTAGHIYDVHLNLRTNGTIAALLEKEEEKIYYDLTRLTLFEDAGGSGADLAIYRYANSYIVSPDHTPEYDKDGNMVFEADGVTPHYIQYDGYCFDASVIGNGQPGIINHGTQTLFPSNANIKPKSARLLWESDLGLVTNVELLFGYVRFRVPNHESRGNAVIAVYDENGTVLWSWHIWITDPPADKTFENGESDIIMLDRNLGAIRGDVPTSGDTALETYGLYYQWGRKDPSMGPNSFDYSRVDLTTKPYYDYSSRERNAAEIVQFPKPTKRDGVENPMFLILPTAQQKAYYFNWMEECNDILWGYHADEGTMLKTIYDPCPYGYRVPLHSEMSIVFENAATSRNTYGQTVGAGDNAIFFPYAGYKGVDRDLQSLVLSWNYVGKKGDYMTSTISKETDKTIAGHPVLNHRGRVYLTSENSWQETVGYNYTTTDTESKYRVLDYANRRTAASVRCVKNYPAGSLQALITPSQSWYVPGSEIKLLCEGVTAESSIVWAELVVRSIDTGRSKVLYTTPAGYTESLQPIWSHEEIFIVGELGGEFWSESYEFELTTKNGFGVTNVTTKTIYNHDHDMAIDLSAWESADEATTLNNLTPYTRRFVVQTSGVTDVPASVTVTYADNGTIHTLNASRTTSSGTNHTYEVSFRMEEAGTKEFIIKAVCNEISAHTITASHMAQYQEKVLYGLDYYFRPVASKWFYWAGEEIVFEYWASSPNGNLTEIEIIYDYETSMNNAGSNSALYPAGTTLRTFTPNAPTYGSSTAPKTYTFDNTFVANDKNGRLQARMTYEDEFGVTATQDHSCYIIYADYEGWSGNKMPDTPFTLSIIISGGAEPQATGVVANIGGQNVSFTKDNSYTGTSGRYSDTKWTARFNDGAGSTTLAEGDYTDNTLTLTFWDGVLTQDAPDVTVKLAPIAIELFEADKNYAFVGAKSSGNVALSYKVTSPNGNLKSITIKENGTTLTTVTPTTVSSYEGTYTYTPTTAKLGTRTFTIEVEDASGVTEVSTTSVTSTAMTVYRVTQKNNTNFTAGGKYLIENKAYEDYFLYDSGDSVEASNDLSPNAFVTFSGAGTSQTFLFASGDYASGGDGNEENVDATATPATTYTVSYTDGWSNNDYFRIYRTVSSGWNTYTYYWAQNSATNVQVRRNANNSCNWNFYEVTTE